MALTKCTECGKEISEKATVCPNCGAPIGFNEPTPKKTMPVKEKKKGSCLKTVLGVLIAFIVILFLIGSCGSDEEVKDVTSESSNNAKIQEDIDTNVEKTTFQVGEVAEYKDVQVSVLSYEESSGNNWGTPEDGNVFVFLNVEITNNSDEEIGVSSLVSFDEYCDDYKLDYSSNAFMALSTENMQQLDGSIATGKKMNGYLCVEVPTDWETIEIYYKDNVWLGSDFKFVITK